MRERERSVPSPLSGAPMHEWLHVPCDWRRPDASVGGGGYSLWWSDEDRFGQLLPRPSQEEIRKFYEVPSYYTHRTAGREAGDTPSRTDPTATEPGLIARLLTALAWRADRGREPTLEWWRRTLPEDASSFLEIGCGSGGNMIAVSPLLQEVVGVEPDPLARKAAEDRGLAVVPGTAEDLPASLFSKRWDVVALMHVLEHCLDPRSALKNARSLLKPGGRLVVEVPNNDCLGLVLKKASWHWLDVPRHLNFFTSKSLIRYCIDAGFDFIEIEYRGYCRQYSQNWIDTEAQIDAIFRKKRPEEARSGYHALLQAAQLLATLPAPAARRYDSVRVICAA